MLGLNNLNLNNYNSYTKDEVNVLLNGKLSVNDGYTKGEVDTLLNGRLSTNGGNLYGNVWLQSDETKNIGVQNMTSSVGIAIQTTAAGEAHMLARTDGGGWRSLLKLNTSSQTLLPQDTYAISTNRNTNSVRNNVVVSSGSSPTANLVSTNSIVFSRA